MNDVISHDKHANIWNCACKIGWNTKKNILKVCCLARLDLHESGTIG
jgi:hypothetical protein